MKNRYFICRLLLMSQTFISSIFISKFLFDEKLIKFSKIKYIYLTEFILLSIGITIIWLLVLKIISNLLFRFLKDDKKSKNKRLLG